MSLYDHILCINTVGDMFELQFNNVRMIGSDSMSNLVYHIQQLTKINKPTYIYLLTGPGSFTSIRIGITAALMLSHTWNVPIRACRIIDCIAQRPLVFRTGTNLYMVHQPDGTIEYLPQDAIDFDACMTDIPNTGKPLPALLDAMLTYLHDKPDSVTVEPYYSIQPGYL